MSLANLAKKVADSFGLAHQVELGVLRHYIKTTSESILTKEIKGIKTSVLLRTLWEAGLSAPLQEVVLGQLKKVS